jgi:hypothetical protein
MHSCLLLCDFFPEEASFCDCKQMQKILYNHNRKNARTAGQVKADSSELIVRKTLTGSSARVTGRPMTR